VAFVFAFAFSGTATTPSSTVTSTSGYQRRRVTLLPGPSTVTFEVVGLDGDVVGVSFRLCSLLVDVCDNLAADALLTGLVVAHNAAARRDDERPVVTGGEISLLPLLELVGRRRSGA